MDIYYREHISIRFLSGGDADGVGGLYSEFYGMQNLNIFFVLHNYISNYFNYNLFCA